MDENAKGGKTYNRLIRSIRVSGTPVGSKHHQFDKQFKEWCKNKTPEEINKNKLCPKFKENKKLSKTKAEKFETKIAASKVVPVTKTKKMLEAERESRILEKYEQMKRKKLADSLKSNCCCRHIKSVGNGL